MKSFFKKLAFVMALAMVVTLAAPAAQSALAATEFTYAYQEGGAVTALYMQAGDLVDLRFMGVKDYADYTLEWKSENPKVATVNQKGEVKAVENGTTNVYLTVGDGSVYTSTPVKVVVGTQVNVALGTAKDALYTEYTLPLGETVDFNFYGVKDYDKAVYTCSWSSDNEEVATVDAKGVVTPVAAGVAEIKLVINNNVTGEVLNAAVTVTVPSPVVELTYVVKQLSDKKAQLTFNADLENIAATDVVLTKVYDGDIEVAWPLKNVEIKDNKITVEPYVDFADGDEYIVRVGAKDEGTAFTTVIGAVDEVRVSYKSMNKDGKAYTNGEDGEDIDVILDVALYSKGVDVTGVYGKEDVTYTLSAENDNIMIDEYEGIVNFSKDGVKATVLATYVTYDDEDNEITKLGAVEMISEMAPAYKVTGVKAWTLTTEPTKKVDWSKPLVHKIPAYDDGYTIVALITDNYGNTISTVDAGYNADADGICDFTNSRLEQEGYYFQFSSANVEKLLVGENDGTVTTYVQTQIPAIIGLYNTNLETESQFVRNLSAMPITVDAARKIDKITVDSSLTLVTDDINGTFTTGKVTLKIFDQYNQPWKSTDDVKVTATCSVAGTTAAHDGETFQWNNTSNGYDVAFDGKDIECSKSSFKVTFKEESTGKTASTTISLKDPKRYDSNEDGKVDETDDIKVTSNSLEANGANQYIDGSKKPDATQVKATVNYFLLSNGYKVGNMVENNATNNVEDGVGFTLVTDKNQLALTTADTKKGDLFLVIYDPNDNIVGSTEAASSNGLGVAPSNGLAKYEVVVANPVDHQMQYMPTGTYKVKVLTVSSFNKKGQAVFSTKASTNFKVENTNPAVKLNKQEALASDFTNINDIVEDTLSFTLGGAKWNDFKAEMIADVKVRENVDSGHIVITSVTINVPTDTKSEDRDYYTVTVDVNKAVAVPAGYFTK